MFDDYTASYLIQDLFKSKQKINIWLQHKFNNRVSMLYNFIS